MLFPKTHVSIFVSVILFITACKEETIKPLPGEGGFTSDALARDLVVDNRPGEVKIAYKLPADPNLLYVEAKWMHKGVERNAKSSYYSDTLTLQGFGDTSEYDVRIYSVDKAERRSEPVTVKVKPLTPPVKEVLKSLAVKPDFGGVNISFVNPTQTNVVITAFTVGDSGEILPADAFYTNLPEYSFSIRNMDATEKKFGIFVKDRWDNYSDTLYTTLTPLFELQLNKALFKEYIPYPGDVNDNIYSAAYPMRNLWDNGTAIFVTKQGIQTPLSFTIDLGVKAKLSRMKYLQRQSTAFYFTSGTPELFEVYGSNNPSPDGGWSSWTLLQSCVSKKPSGLPLGTVSNDDLALAKVGEDFNFPANADAYRYLRFKVTKTYGNANNITFAELTFWGAY